MRRRTVISGEEHRWMTCPPFERQWLIGSAGELAETRAWFKANLADGTGQLKLLAFEEDRAGGARLAVCCSFKSEADAAKFRECHLTKGRAAPAEDLPE